MRGAGSKGRWWLVSGILFILYIVIAFTNMTPPGQPLNTPGSTYASGPKGAMALQRLWERLGLSWSNWEQDPVLLPTGGSQVFVSMLPQQGTYGAKDITQFLNYVKTGHTVVWIDNRQDPLLTKMGLQVENVPAQRLTTLQKVAQPLISHHQKNGQELDGATVGAVFSGLDASTHQWLSGSGLKAASVLYETPAGQVVGAEFARGKGRILLWSAPSLWENGSIDTGDNFKVAWDLIGNRAIFWDEYAHGYTNQSTLRWMFRGASVISAVLAGLALLLYLYRHFWRFGPIRNPVSSSQTTAMEYVEALAWHLKRRNLRDYQFEQMVRLTRARLARLPVTEETYDAEKIARRLRSLGGDTAGQLWKDWQSIAERGYQPRHWRRFLRLTKQLWQKTDLEQIANEKSKGGTRL